MEQMGTEYTAGPELGSEEPSRRERVMEQGKERAAQVGGMAKEKVVGKLDAQKQQLCEQLEKLADGIEGMSGELEGPSSQFATKAASYVRKAEGVLKEKSTDELVSMAVTEVRDRPAAFIAGAFALGFLGARLIKS